MASDNLQQKAFSGMIWGFLEKFSLQLFGFIQGVILARLLMPSDFGLIAMAGVFSAISAALIDSGFSTALIRKQHKSELDYSTVFVINVIMSCVMALILILCSSVIADFYHEPMLTAIVCLNALQIALGSLTAVQGTRLMCNMQFKKISIIRVTSAVISGTIAIVMAFMGFGVWSLIYPSIFCVPLMIMLYWHFQHWFPGFKFSKESFHDLFAFGSKMLASTLLATIYNNIYPMVIGKKYTSADLGYFSKGQSYASLPAMTITEVLGCVLYPVLSELQDDDERLLSAYRRVLRLSAYLIFPIIIGVAALARPLIITMITIKWEQTIIYLQILCLALMWYPIHALNLNLLKVKGRSDLFLRLEIIKKIIGVAILFLTLPFGVFVMCIGSVFSSIFSLFVNTYYTGKILNLGFLKQMRDLLPSIFYSFSMGVIVWLSCLLFSNMILQLIIGIVVGVSYYYFISVLTHSQDFAYFKEIVNNNIISRFSHDSI